MGIGQDLSPETNWLTAADAGSRVGKSDQAVLSWITTGDFASDEWRKEGRFYKVREDAVFRIALTKPKARKARLVGAVSAEAAEPHRDQIGEPPQSGIPGNGEGLGSQVKLLTEQLQNAVDERDRLRADYHVLREAAADLHTALGRFVGR